MLCRAGVKGEPTSEHAK